MRSFKNLNKHNMKPSEDGELIGNFVMTLFWLAFFGLVYYHLYVPH